MTNGLTQDEKDELSSSLLREWWIATTQAFVDVAGSSKALELLAPGFRHHGRSGYQILVRHMSLKEEIASIAPFECLAKTLVSGSPAQVELREDGVIWTVDSCRSAGMCKEICLSFCYHSGVGMVEEASPDYEYILYECLSQGDSRCQAYIGRRGKGLPVGRVIRRYEPESLGLPKQQWSFWSCASIGESWAIVTRAMEEVLGRDKTISLLLPVMQGSGESLGRRMNWTDEGGAALGTIHNAIATVQGCFGMEGDESLDVNSIEIRSCPFAGAPTAICAQFEAFLNGICNSIDPSFEFVYDRMMTKGDKTCHWMIRKKGEDSKKKLTDETTSIDPVKLLAMRYAKGEISEEEFRKKMAVLKEFEL